MSDITEVASVTAASTINSVETLQGLPGGDEQVNLTTNPATKAYSQSSTPPAKYRFFKSVTLDGSGAATLDLTALAGIQDAIDATGLKMQWFRIWGVTGNALVTISPGASNPYAMFGAGNDLVYPAACTRPFHFEFDDQSPTITDVSGVGASQIDFAGTASDVFSIDIGLG